MRLATLAIVTSLLVQEIQAQANSCGGPDLPCEETLSESCTFAIESGMVKAEGGYSLRDAPDGDGCILCVPPSGEWTGPLPCETCDCDAATGKLDSCGRLGPRSIFTDESGAACPPSEYIFSDYEAKEWVDSCPSFEEMEVQCSSAPNDKVNESSAPGDNAKESSAPVDNTSDTVARLSFFSSMMATCGLFLACCY